MSDKKRRIANVSFIDGKLIVQITDFIDEHEQLYEATHYNVDDVTYWALSGGIMCGTNHYRKDE